MITPTQYGTEGMMLLRRIASYQMDAAGKLWKLVDDHPSPMPGEHRPSQDERHCRLGFGDRRECPKMCTGRLCGYAKS